MRTAPFSVVVETDDPVVAPTGDRLAVVAVTAIVDTGAELTAALTVVDVSAVVGEEGTLEDTGGVGPALADGVAAESAEAIVVAAAGAPDSLEVHPATTTMAIADANAPAKTPDLTLLRFPPCHEIRQSQDVPTAPTFPDGFLGCPGVICRAVSRHEREASATRRWPGGDHREISAVVNSADRSPCPTGAAVRLRRRLGTPRAMRTPTRGGALALRPLCWSL